MRAHMLCVTWNQRGCCLQEAANMAEAKRAAMIANDLAECEVRSVSI
eukprot:COSAG05_NODE_590_length_8500_cov_9.363290_2_plen_47_part_00